MAQPSYADRGHAPATASNTGGTNVMAILAMVFAFVFSPLGIVFGHIAKKQIQQTGEQGEGLAKAGYILGWIFTALGLLWIAFVIVVAMNSPTTA